MEQKQKMMALLGVVGVLAGAGIAYIWFSDSHITQEVAYKIQSKSETTTSTGNIVISDSTPLGYISLVEGMSKLNRQGNESLIQKDTTLQGGDILTTESGSTIEIIFADNSFIRIEENSKLILASINEVKLENGGLWARILKPLQDTSIFTINTSDLSAGVRGTVVHTTTSSGETRIDVIDTTVGTGSAVEVRVTTASGILQEGLTREESLTIRQDFQKKVKLNMDQMLQDEQIRDNLKKDILLMHQMMVESMSGNRKTPIEMHKMPQEQFQKMNDEIMESLPKNNELNKFFISQAIENDARQLDMYSTAFSGSTQHLSTEEQMQLLISFTSDDMQLNGLKKELKKKRENVGEFMDEVKKQAYQNEVNKLETQIRDFDANWSRKERSRIEAAKQAAAEEQANINAIEGTGGTQISDDPTETQSGTLDSQSSVGIRVPNIVQKDQSGSNSSSGINPKPAVLPKTQSGTLLPKPTIPSRIVSAPVVPIGVKKPRIYQKIVSPMAQPR